MFHKRFFSIIQNGLVDIDFSRPPVFHGSIIYEKASENKNIRGDLGVKIFKHDQSSIDGKIFGSKKWGEDPKDDTYLIGASFETNPSPSLPLPNNPQPYPPILQNHPYEIQTSFDNNPRTSLPIPYNPQPQPLVLQYDPDFDSVYIIRNNPIPDNFHHYYPKLFYPGIIPKSHPILTNNYHFSVLKNNPHVKQYETLYCCS